MFSDFRNLLGLVIIVFAFAIVFGLMFVNIPKDNIHLLDISIGFMLGGGVTTVVGYFYTKSKEDIIEK